MSDYCCQNRISISDVEAKNKFGTALDIVQGNAQAHLEFPIKGKRNVYGFTDSIIEIIKKEKQSMRNPFLFVMGLMMLIGEAFNNVLKIAYNFTNDVIPFLDLLISISDLKPIILWSTIGEYFLLSESFRNLPWTRSKNKFSMKNCC